MTELSRRRTFAIISHPDAGKTTLTEKLLLYGGAVQLAGSISARKNQRATTSDWIELEKQRGISISSTVLQFDCMGYRINLLDTPGHKDFSEDTYRVLTAVDAVIMVIDAGKGIESQTRKLFEVCRQRRIPIFTFMNKLDRPTREPLELLDELEKVLGLIPYAMNWPLGTGIDFQGVYDRRTKEVHRFEKTPGGAYKAPVTVHERTDAEVAEGLLPQVYKAFMDEVDVLDHAGAPFDPKAVLDASMTPVFFGSASNNFGVELLLKGFLGLSPAPMPRRGGSRVIHPEDKPFSGFIFKIQGNMDPRHRDRVAFLRVCSGRFTRDMNVLHERSGRRVRLTNSHKLFGQEREILNDAWPGDIIGLVGHQDFTIGDTLTEDPSIVYKEIPHFPPECFAWLHNPNPGKYKTFRKGLEQILAEGIVQRFWLRDSLQVSPLLAAVGPLQFEVAQYRLEAEYDAPTTLERVGWEGVRWIESKEPGKDITGIELSSGLKWGKDEVGLPVVFFMDQWALRYFSDRHPEVVFFELSPEDRVKALAFSQSGEPAA